MTSDHVFVTSEGLELPLQPLAPPLVESMRLKLRAAWLADGKRLDPPTYTVTTAAGEVQTYPHDAESIQAETTTDEERAAWAAYEQDTRAFDAAATARLVELVLLRGLRQVNTPPEAWLEEMAEDGIAVPEDPRERRLFYTQVALVPVPADVLLLVRDVLRLTMHGLPKEQVEAAEAAFRDLMEGWA